MKITDYLAIYAASLSTLVFVWNFIQSRPRVKVNFTFAVEVTDNGIAHGVNIFVRNVSSYELHLTSIDLLYSYMTPTLMDRLSHAWRFKTLPRRIGWVHASLSTFAVDSGCPMSLGPRKSHRVFIPQSSVDQVLSEASGPAIIACVHDQLWNRVYSRKFDCRVPKARHT